ncbi:hypothetical protein PYCC9005_002049 [Savitreella phatthalungensis]
MIKILLLVIASMPLVLGEEPIGYPASQPLFLETYEAISCKVPVGDAGTYNIAHLLKSELAPELDKLKRGKPGAWCKPTASRIGDSHVRIVKSKSKRAAGTSSTTFSCHNEAFTFTLTLNPTTLKDASFKDPNDPKNVSTQCLTATDL